MRANLSFVFQIYGPFPYADGEYSANWADVDECNFYEADGNPRYIVRPPEIVDENLPFCSTMDAETNNWNYILGCYRGDLTYTKVLDAKVASIPPDCYEVTFEDLAGVLSSE